MGRCCFTNDKWENYKRELAESKDLKGIRVQRLIVPCDGSGRCQNWFLHVGKDCTRHVKGQKLLDAKRIADQADFPLELPDEILSTLLSGSYQNILVHLAGPVKSNSKLTQEYMPLIAHFEQAYHSGSVSDCSGPIKSKEYGVFYGYLHNEATKLSRWTRDFDDVFVARVSRHRDSDSFAGLAFVKDPARNICGMQFLSGQDASAFVADFLEEWENAHEGVVG